MAFAKYLKKEEVNGNPWNFKKIASTASNVIGKMNQVVMSWPKTSSTVYPGQTIRVNTGWSNDSMPENMTLTAMPHKSLMENNLLSIPQVIDSSNQGQELVQQVLNNNNFPVRIEYKVSEKGDETFLLHKLDHNLTIRETLEFDWGNLLTGIAQTAIQVLPALL